MHASLYLRVADLLEQLRSPIPSPTVAFPRQSVPRAELVLVARWRLHPQNPSMRQMFVDRQVWQLLSPVRDRLLPLLPELGRSAALPLRIPNSRQRSKGD